jgi:uncharacterized protein YndB with AHSA1/START domain
MAWTTEASAESGATAAEIWARYEDVPGWTRWDHELERVTLEGPFMAGARGTLKPKDGPVLPYELTRVERERGFSDRTPMPHRLLPLAAIEFEHRLTPLASGGTRITHAVRIRGLLGPLVARMLGPKMVVGLPTAVDALARLAGNGA